MATSTPESQWQSISRRKLADQQKALHVPPSISITIPQNLLPKDPPQPAHGPQPVHQIPSTLLNQQDNQITTLPVPTLLSKLHSGSLTAKAATEAYIRRASLTHQLTNCLTEPLFARALDRAERLDAYLNRTSKPVGPLHGLPISVKDTFNIEGVDTTLGMASLAYKPATLTSPLIKLLESLGCVIIAKTNIPQTLSSLDSVNNVFGRTYNPFNRLLTPGGSSGGEGVLISMHGSALGIGTDIGGSIRIPAMCNGIYGFKPSEGRFPYGEQGSLSVPGTGRAGVQAVAGPIARSVADVELVVREVMKVSSLFGGDCLPLERPWDVDSFQTSRAGSGPNGEFVIGVLRSDGNCTLLPPITNIMDEISTTLRSANQTLNIPIRVIDLPTPSAWTKSQSVMSKLMGIDGGVNTSRLLLETGEPLVPWMKTRFKHGGKPVSLDRVAELQDVRAQLEKEMIRDIWTFGDQDDEFGRKRRTVDALICPVAAHPTPEIERWNAVGYTSSWVLFDYPAATVPVREVRESDLQLGRKMSGKSLGSWDDKCRELWDETKTDRRVYLGSTLSVQCVTARLEDERLVWVMGVVDGAIKAAREREGRDGGRESKL